MGLHGVNDNKTAPVLRDLNLEAYNYHGVAPQPAQIDMRLGHLEQPLTETKGHALVCAHYIKAFSKSQVYKQVSSIYKAPAVCVGSSRIMNHVSIVLKTRRRKPVLLQTCQAVAVMVVYQIHHF